MKLKIFGIVITNLNENTDYEWIAANCIDWLTSNGIQLISTKGIINNDLVGWMREENGD